MASCAESQPPGTPGIPAACRCSSHTQVDHRRLLWCRDGMVPRWAPRLCGSLVLWMAGWIHSRQLEVIDFLREENRVLREQLGGRRLRFTDDQRRRLAIMAISSGPTSTPTFARQHETP